MSSHKLSLLSGILININIMLGSGIFINTVLLTRQAGSLGALAYIVVALLLLPLILAIGQLLHYHHESGTFYDFGRAVSPFFGFLSSWSYFTAKLCTCALGIHVCLSFLQQVIPLLQSIPILLFDTFVIIIFTLLNLLNLKIGKSIQYSFIAIKLIPIFFVIFVGLYLFNGSYFTPDTFIWSGVPLSVPFVLYAFSGFEASCSLSSRLKDPKKNGPLAIFISFGAVVTTIFLYQLLFYGSLGMALGTIANGYLGTYPALLDKLALPAGAFKNNLQTILSIAIASSTLGASYGVMYSNGWNLYTLAHNNHTFFRKLFTTLNAHGMPYACILAEGTIALAYLLITRGNQVPLQQVSALGGTIAYTLSSIALLILTYKSRKVIGIIPVLSLISCALLIGSFIWTVTINGPTSMLMVFFALLIFGSFMFYKKHEPRGNLEIFEEI